jgi:hypothetical protein
MTTKDDAVTEEKIRAESLAAEDAERSAGSKWKARLRKALVPIYKPTRSLVTPNMWRSFVLQPPIFELWYRGRAWKFLATHGMKSFENGDVPKEKNFLERVSSYNQSQLWEWHRTRTEKIMAVLRCIDDRPKKPKMLVIGPRNEAELLLLHLYGFDLSDIESIDIFSYSPHIQCMDMHDLKFEDNRFDIVYSAWTLKYSYDLAKACSEIVRVLKPGGLVATGFSHRAVKTDVIGAPIEGGLDELLQQFSSHVDWVFWKEALPVATGHEVTTIFRIKK